MRNYIRDYRFTAGGTGTMGFTIGAPDPETGRVIRCKFSVERGDSESNNTATVDLYNLGPHSKAVLLQDNCVAELRAGYDGDLATIISGVVSHFEDEEDGADTCTSIEISDGLVATRDTNISLSYSGNVKGVKILQDAAAQMGCGIVFSPSCTFPSFRNFAFVGTAVKLLHQVCGAAGNNYSIQSGIINVCAPNEPLTTAAYVISEKTGLIGAPTRLYDSASSSNSDNANTSRRKTQIGWKATFLMNGHIQVNDLIRLESRSVVGTFRVSKIDASGDSEGTGSDSWSCTAELLEV